MFSRATDRQTDRQSNTFLQVNSRRGHSMQLSHSCVRIQRGLTAIAVYYLTNRHTHTLQRSKILKTDFFLIIVLFQQKTHARTHIHTHLSVFFSHSLFLSLFLTHTHTHTHTAVTNIHQQIQINSLSVYGTALCYRFPQ